MLAFPSAPTNRPASAQPAQPYPIGRHTNTAYDLAGRPTRAFVSMQDAATYNAALERDIRTYVYDAAGRVIEDRVRPNNGGMGTSELVLKYGYDAANNRTSIEWPDQYRATYLYDAANRANRVEFGPAGSPALHSANITVDSLSRRTGLNRSNGVNTAYAYETDSDLAQLNHAFAPSAGQTPATFGFEVELRPASRRTPASAGPPGRRRCWLPPDRIGLASRGRMLPDPEHPAQGVVIGLMHLARAFEGDVDLIALVPEGLNVFAVGEGGQHIAA